MPRLDHRIGILFVAFLGLLVVAIIRASYLGVVQAGPLQRAAATQQVTQVTVPAPRGTITDRHGVPLAISESAEEVVADPYLIKAAPTVADKLAPLLGQPPTTVLAELTKPNTGWVPLAKQLPSGPAQAIASLHINGLSMTEVMTRYYPRGSMAAQVLGGVYSNGHGNSGVEEQYDQQLSGSDGVRRIVSDARGQPISVDDVRPTRPGETVTLTIDAALQSEVEQVMAGVGAQYSPKSATAIALDPSTGAILALANWPSVNANTVPWPPPLDDAVTFDYEPGSTFKAITVAGALQDGKITPSTEFNIPPALQIGGYAIHDAEGHGDETLTVAQILKVSSNIGADEIGIYKLGAQRFDHWVHAFGFGSPTGVDLPGEEGGIVRPWWQYFSSSMGNLPMGQGESVTLMQMVTAYAAIANGGVLRAPHVVQAVGGTAQALPRGRRVISPAVALELREMLRGVFADGGTASGAAIPGYDMAGKTGTANIAVNGQYTDSYVASFIGMVPVRDPQLLVAVMVNQPQGGIYGGAVAAPAFQKIVGWAVPYFGLSPR